MVKKLSEKEMDRIAELMVEKLEAKRQETQPQPRKRHTKKRRFAMVVVVLITGVIGHKVIELPGCAELLQSFELVIAAAIEVAFSKVKELE